MSAYLRIWIVLILAIASFAIRFDPDCISIKQRFVNLQAVSKGSDVQWCIIRCFLYTTLTGRRTTPEECFNDFVQPYILKLLKKQIPTNAEMQDCLDAKDRSKCRDTLLYYFSKFYKDNYSPDYNKQYARFLYFVWVNNPDVKSPLKFPDWDLNVITSMSSISFDKDKDIQKAIKMTSLSDPLLFPVIEGEMRRHCYKPATEYQSKLFCRLRTVLNIVKKIRLLAKGKQKYGNKFKKYVGAVQSNFASFSILHPERENEIVPGTERAKATLLDTQFNELADLTRAGNFQNLKSFLQFMPEPYLLEKACKQKTFPTVKRRCCILEKVVIQLLMYSDILAKRTSAKKRKAVTINFSLNLRAVITELRGEEVFKLILDNRYQNTLNQQQTASLIEGKFGQLKNYFSKLQSFNMQKASADVSYVKGRIKYYQGKTQTAIKDVSIKVGSVLKAALITQGLEVAEKAVKLTFAIAEACNPFKTVFNGGTATDIMDALGELSRAISRLVHAVALKNAWTKVIATVKKINNGFRRNAEFLSAVGRIVAKIQLNDFPDDDEFEQCKSTFLRLYNAYSPKVDKQMLAVLAVNIDGTVTAGCDLINDATGSAANAYVAYVKKNLFCQKAAASTASLKAIFEEIYDFQFEFIENMASYLRSATGYHASKQMVTLSENPMTKNSDANERQSELKANIILAHITYEMQKQGVIQSLCDFLEYKEGGETPVMCQGSTTDVPTLLSYIPKRCNSLTDYVSIPISNEPNPPPGFININKLYSGKEISFTIPSYDWLKQRKWIGNDDNLKPMYIQNFQIFLPTIDQGNKKIKVSVRSLGGNSFKDGKTRYSLIPSNSFSVVYKGGKQFYPCSGKLIENPYSICEDRKLPKICVLSLAPSLDDATMLYPTPFARFKIKARGINVTQTPDPQTNLDIKVKIDMCVFGRDSLGRKRANLQPKSGCCSGNNYWNDTVRACHSCSSGSTSNLNGYYCERNQNALFPGKVKESSSS